MVSVSFAVGDHLRYCTSVKDPFVGLFVMSCGTLFFCFALAFSFIAVKWPKMAKRPNKHPKETSVYRKFVRFMEDSKMKTLSSICWLIVLI